MLSFTRISLPQLANESRLLLASFLYSQLDLAGKTDLLKVGFSSFLHTVIYLNFDTKERKGKPTP